jgi:uncharacterized protein (TIGR02145 family)
MKTFTFNKTFSSALVILLSLHLHGQVTVDLRVFIEGPFELIEMNTDLNVAGYIPLQQPFNTMPWNYNGNEEVVAIPNTNVTDWVLVEILQEEIIGGEIVYSVQLRKVAFILNNGALRDLDGTSLLLFPINLADFYVRILHRNHVPVVSAVTLTEVAGIYSYDFTTGADQAMGDFDSQNELAPGIWGMIAGDGNADFQIDNEDKDDTWVSQEGFIGYQSADYNLDGIVDEADKTDKWEPNVGKGFNVPATYPVPMECGEPFTDARDGQVYNTVLIGTQCWMAENLNIGTMVLGTSEMSNNGIIEKYCYDNNEDNCATYGGLYQWNEMMQYENIQGGQGICPTEWHQPEGLEWGILNNYLGGASVSGGKMKEAGFIHWNPPNTGATNESGFTALPGGYRYINGGFYFQGDYGYFWTSELNAGQYKWAWLLYYTDEINHWSYELQTEGRSVRCLKD